MKELIQNTPEWLAWRHKGIGASEANIIMGVSLHKTPLELWKEKTNPVEKKEDDKNMRFICDKGHILEEVARKNYELETFMDWKPKLVEYGEETRLRASLDGWGEELNAVWECKYMGAEKYKALKNNDLPVRERVPKEYWPQLMHQVMVTGADQVHLTGIIDHKVNKELDKHETDQFTLSFNVGGEHVIYIEKELLPKLIEFIGFVDNKIKPTVSKDDSVQSKDAELGKLLTKYKSVKTKLSKLEKEEKELKKQIFGITLKIHNRVDCKGYKITETIGESKETLDVEKYLKEKEINLIELGYVKTTKGRKTQKITLKK